MEVSKNMRPGKIGCLCGIGGLHDGEVKDNITMDQTKTLTWHCNSVKDREWNVIVIGEILLSFQNMFLHK